jgi:hypothetical protein
VVGAGSWILDSVIDSRISEFRYLHRAPQIQTGRSRALGSRAHAPIGYLILLSALVAPLRLTNEENDIPAIADQYDSTLVDPL